MQKSLVKNASDEKQVKHASKMQRLNRETELSDLRVVLATPEGRRLYWRLMCRCRIFESIWDPSARIHYNAGVQDIGHFLLAEQMEADPAAYMKMVQEHQPQPETKEKGESDGESRSATNSEN